MDTCFQPLELDSLRSGDQLSRGRWPSSKNPAAWNPNPMTRSSRTSPSIPPLPEAQLELQSAYLQEEEEEDEYAG